MQATSTHARTGQAHFPHLHEHDRVRSVHARRPGSVVRVYADGSAAVLWDDGEPQPEGLAHERMPRALLELIEPATPDRTDHTQSVSKIVADGLRAAVLAPDLASALDAAGGALTDIVSLARSDQPAPRTQCVNEPFCVARDSADRTMHTLDRLSYLFEAIARLACDADGAIEDLACVGREIADAETDRIDTVFTRLAHHASATGVCHE